MKKLLSVFLFLAAFSNASASKSDSSKFLKHFGGSYNMGFSQLNYKVLQSELKKSGIVLEPDFFTAGASFLAGNDKALIRFSFTKTIYLANNLPENGSFINFKSSYFDVEFLQVLINSQRFKFPAGIGFGNGFHRLDFADTFPVTQSFPAISANSNSLKTLTLESNSNWYISASVQPQIKTNWLKKYGFKEFNFGLDLKYIYPIEKQKWASATLQRISNFPEDKMDSFFVGFSTIAIFQK